MTGFLISTTTSGYSLPDLGLILTHPTIERDFSLEFSPEELAMSNYLTQAINSGGLTLKLIDAEYNSYSVDSTEYYAGLSVQNQFVRAEIEDYVTADELAALPLTTLVNAAATGLSVTSTAALTRNVYVATGKFQKWKISPGDKAVITGGAAAGTYTVSGVTDQQQFTVTTSIANTSGVGSLALFHPTGSTLIGIDTSPFTTVSGTNLQSVLQSIDFQLINALVSTVNTIQPITGNGSLVNPLSVQPATATQSGVVTITAQTFSGVKTFLSSPTSPGTGLNSERFGANATTSAGNSTVLGSSAVSNAADSTVIGALSSASSTNSTLVGSSVIATGSNTIGIGKSVSVANASSIAIGNLAIADGSSNSDTSEITVLGFSATGRSRGVVIGSAATMNATGEGGTAGSVVIGKDTSSTGSSSIVLGGGASNTGTRSIVIGSSSSSIITDNLTIGPGLSNNQSGTALIANSITGISKLIIGKGLTSSSPSTGTFTVNAGSTTGITGGTAILAGGLGGANSDAGGSVKLQTAPPGTGLTLQDRVEVTASGFVKIFQALELSEVSSVSTGPINTGRLFVKSSNNDLYYKTEAGTEFDLLTTADSNHRTVRHLIHFISQGPADGFTSGAFKETLPSGHPFPTSIIWWTSVAKTQKIVELTITRNNNQSPATEQWKMYDTNGITVLTTVTDTFTYSGPHELSRTRTII